VWPWTKGAPEIWGFPFNISATAEASDFKFGTQLVFAKAHHIITPRGKRVGGLGLGELPKILGFPYNIMQRLGLASSNLARSWGLPRPIIKSHADERVWPWARGAPQNLGFLFNIYTMVETKKFKFGTQLGFAKAHHKTTPRGQVGVALG